MDIAVLGPLEVGGTSTGFPPRDGVVLEALATHPGEVLSPEVLAEVLWGDAVPKSWPKLVQGCIVRLRKLLGPGAIETLSSGYRLRAHADDLDHRRFERLIAKAREHLAQGDADRAAVLVADALAVHPLTPATRRTVRQQRVQESPLLIAQVMTIVHNTDLHDHGPNHSRDTL